MAGKLKAEVVVTDRGMDSLMRELAAVKRGAFVQVGVFADSKNGGGVRENGMVMAELAAIHEYGTRDGRVPERSFLRSTFDEKRKEYFTVLLPRLVKDLYERKRSATETLELIGMQLASDVKGKIVKQDPSWPALNPEYKARKESKTRAGSTGSVKMLIDTGRLLASITYAVVFGNERRVKQ